MKQIFGQLSAVSVDKDGTMRAYLSSPKSGDDLSDSTPPNIPLSFTMDRGPVQDADGTWRLGELWLDDIEARHMQMPWPTWLRSGLWASITYSPDQVIDPKGLRALSVQSISVSLAAGLDVTATAKQQ